MTFLLEWTVKVALILGAAWVATFLGRKLSAATRHGIWAAALAGVVIAPALTFIVPPPQPHAMPSGRLVATVTSSQAIARVNTAAQLPWLRVIWGTGCALSLLRLLAGFVWMRRSSRPLLDERCRNMVRKIAPGLDVTLVTTGSIAMPITWGVFAPRIALPSGAETWQEDRL